MFMLQLEGVYVCNTFEQVSVSIDHINPGAAATSFIELIWSAYDTIFSNDNPDNQQTTPGINTERSNVSVAFLNVLDIYNHIIFTV